MGVVVVTGAIVSLPTGIIAVSLGWLGGLFALGFWGRQQWNRLVTQTSFEPAATTHAADLEKLFSDRSVYVETNVSGTFAQTRTEITTRVDDVDASFTVRFTYSPSDSSDGVQTGFDDIDEQFLVEGKEENVSQILSTDVAAALLDIETPGTMVVTGESVRYDVPFARLSPAELETIAEAVVVIARRVETVGR